MTQADRFALDHEGEAGVHGAEPRALVLAEQALVVGGIRTGVELAAECSDVRERRLEPLARAAERCGLFLRDLGVDSPVCVLKPAHRSRATASA